MGVDMTSLTAKSPLGATFQWFRNWRASRAAVTNLAHFSQGDLTRIASDIGVSVLEMRALAATGPHAADLLPRRLKSLGLDPDETARAQPAILRDLERLCSFCQSKRRCEHDLDQIEASWPSYCPNASALRDLVANPATSRGHHAG